MCYNANNALFHKCLTLPFVVCILNTCIFAFGLFPCAVTIFFACAITKWVLLFFCILYFGILHLVYISVAHNHLFACVHTFLLFWIKYAIACLLYFLQSFCWLLHCVFPHNYSCLYLLLFCKFLPVSLRHFWWLFVLAVCFFLRSCNFICIDSWKFIRIALVLLFCCSFCLVSCLLFLLCKSAVDINLCSLVSGFLGVAVCVFLLCCCLYVFISYCAPLVSPPILPMILSDHPDYTCQLPGFSCCDQTLHKHVLLDHLGSFLSCFWFSHCRRSRSVSL